jgi:hypothetical protein
MNDETTADTIRSERSEPAVGWYFSGRVDIGRHIIEQRRGRIHALDV